MNSQEFNVFLRERSLSFWKSQKGKPANLMMYTGIKVNGKFEEVDGKQTQFQLSNLSTQLGVYNETIIRGSDILLMEFPAQKEKN
ncbi:gem-associated protein [Anaeramoeba flamelloides]|uniref:Gem-associated protein n=1 Tax=Anaeramoeba flamelloides TaxID=1746091 RepID=A0AAV8A1R2_9EUKA|nr:gem-associated protein [Anaeramoeba flamelloides]KAJ6237422.1 gem-associated protein [Anaeramoeba flamelloides]